jgi:hypothetical protein
VSGPSQPKVDALLVQAHALDVGELRVDFVWARKIRYVYCAGRSCEDLDPGAGYQRLDERWLLSHR